MTIKFLKADNGDSTIIKIVDSENNTRNILIDDGIKKTCNLNKLGFKIKYSQSVEKSSFEIGTDLADIYIQESNLNKNLFYKNH